MKITDKPLQEIESILKHLSQSENVVTLPPGRIISLSESHQSGCFLFHTGIAFLRRTDSRRIVGVIESPTIICTGEYAQVFDSVYVEIVDNARVEVMSSERFQAGINQHQLWKPLSNVYMNILVRYFSLSSHHYEENTLRLVYLRLEELANGPEKIRTLFRPVDYIQQRTTLSRSGIIQQLNTLKSRGILSTHRGFLHSLGQLPESATRRHAAGRAQ